MKWEKQLVGGQLLDLPAGRRLELPGTDPGGLPLTGPLTGTTGATGTNTKGTWGEWSSGLSDDIYGFHITPHNTNVNDRDFLVDIGTGASGSEVVLVANLSQAVTGSNQYAWHCFHVPIYIRRGTRIALRAQANANLLNVTWRLQPLFEPVFLPVCRVCETMGADTSDSGGTNVDPGGSANTKGAYSQLIASTSRRTRLILIRFQNQRDASRQDYSWFVDLATGAAGSESVLISDMLTINSSFHNVFTPDVYGPIPVDIPAGTRISARASCTGTDATDRLIDVLAYGFSP